MKSKKIKREEVFLRAVRVSIQPCQECRDHKNKPSRCPFYGFVGRKNVNCGDFRRA